MAQDELRQTNLLASKTRGEEPLAKMTENMLVASKAVERMVERQVDAVIAQSESTTEGATPNTPRANHRRHRYTGETGPVSARRSQQQAVSPDMNGPLSDHNKDQSLRSSNVQSTSSGSSLNVAESLRDVPRRVRSIVSSIESGHLAGDNKDGQPLLDGRQTPNSEEANGKGKSKVTDSQENRQNITGWIVRDDNQNPVHEVFREWRTDSLSNSEEVDNGLDVAPLTTDHEVINMEEPKKDKAGQGVEISTPPGNGNEKPALTSLDSPTSSGSIWTSNSRSTEENSPNKYERSIDVLADELGQEDDNAPSEVDPGPYKPVPPFGGQGGRTRPRRPRS
jgi:hypothetical protein